MMKNVMFNRLMRKFGVCKKAVEILAAPVEGEAVNSVEIGDAVFGGEMLGRGMAIKPVSGKVYAPVNGTVSLVSGAKHALTILSEKGAEVLIHVGLDTVSLEGKPFQLYVKAEDQVKKGDLLAEFDLNMIQSAGLDTIIPIVILNSNIYTKINRFTGKNVKPGDDIIKLVKV